MKVSPPTEDILSVIKVTHLSWIGPLKLGSNFLDSPVNLKKKGEGYKK